MNLLRYWLACAIDRLLVRPLHWLGRFFDRLASRAYRLKARVLIRQLRHDRISISHMQ